MYTWGSNTLDQCEVSDKAVGSTKLYGGAFQTYTTDDSGNLLAKWGLLEGKRAVCYPSWADRVPGAQLLEGEKLAVDGTIVTGQAAGASINFGLKLVELLAGGEKAQEVRHGIYYC